MTTPEEFEQLIWRIHELLEDAGAAVTWDEHLPDPDNPSRPRQVDVTVRRDGLLTLIECRLHQASQDVTWIEELIGRRASLRANLVIGVSASGFTQGALKKAEAFGIVLRHVEDLTATEVAHWGRAVSIRVGFYEYRDLELSLLFAPGRMPRLSQQAIGELKTYPGLQSLFNASAEKLDESKLLARQLTESDVRFHVHCRLEGFTLCGEPVVQVGWRGVAKLVIREIACAALHRYASPLRDERQQTAIVERFHLGETSVIHDDGARISIVLDLSSIELPPMAQFRFATVSSETALEHETLELIGGHRLNVSLAGGHLKVVCSDVPSDLASGPTT
jgi:hypothetical protein